MFWKKKGCIFGQSKVERSGFAMRIQCAFHNGILSDAFIEVYHKYGANSTVNIYSPQLPCLLFVQAAFPAALLSSSDASLAVFAGSRQCTHSCISVGRITLKRFTGDRTVQGLRGGRNARELHRRGGGEPRPQMCVIDVQTEAYFQMSPDHNSLPARVLILPWQMSSKRYRRSCGGGKSERSSGVWLSTQEARHGVVCGYGRCSAGR